MVAVGFLLVSSAAADDIRSDVHRRTVPEEEPVTKLRFGFPPRQFFPESEIIAAVAAFGGGGDVNIAAAGDVPLMLTDALAP